jgi:hypothetical protein
MKMDFALFTTSEKFPNLNFTNHPKYELCKKVESWSQGGYSQNFLYKFVKISVSLGLSILSFSILKVLF